MNPFLLAASMLTSPMGVGTGDLLGQTDPKRQDVSAVETPSVSSAARQSVAGSNKDNSRTQTLPKQAQSEGESPFVQVTKLNPDANSGRFVNVNSGFRRTIVMRRLTRQSPAMVRSTTSLRFGSKPCVQFMRNHSWTTITVNGNAFTVNSKFTLS